MSDSKKEPFIVVINVGNIPSPEVPEYVAACKKNLSQKLDTSHWVLYPVRKDAAKMQMAFGLSMLARAIENNSNLELSDLSDCLEKIKEILDCSYDLLGNKAHDQE